jgi:imidazolonepropionase-like amidohydrolase
MASQEQAPATAPGSGKSALTNARVFDGRQLARHATVVIEGGRIVSDPAAAQVVDCAGGLLLPGLIDAHVHLDGPGRLETLASYGVTTALDSTSRWRRPPRRRRLPPAGSCCRRSP